MENSTGYLGKITVKREEVIDLGNNLHRLELHDIPASDMFFSGHAERVKIGCAKFFLETVSGSYSTLDSICVAGVHKYGVTAKDDPDKGSVDLVTINFDYTIETAACDAVEILPTPCHIHKHNTALGICYLFGADMSDLELENYFIRKYGTITHIETVYYYHSLQKILQKVQYTNTDGSPVVYHELIGVWVYYTAVRPFKKTDMAQLLELLNTCYDI